jgi:hypothetical protein
MRKNKYTNMYFGWNLKLTFCFMEMAHELLHLNKRSLVQWKIMDMPTSFVFEELFSSKDLLSMAMVGFWNFWVAYKTCTSQRATMNFCMLKIYSGWTFLTNTFAKTQKYKHGGTLKCKNQISFYGANSWTVVLTVRQSFVQWKIMDIPTNCILTIIFFDRDFEFGVD